MAEVLKTTCNRDCPDACGLLVHLEGGKLQRLGGDPDHPVTRGFICERTQAFPKRQLDSERLKSPLIRQGGELQPTSWPQALDLIAERMLTIRAESGPAAILPFRSGGSLGILKHLVDYFFEAFGPVTVKRGDICSGAGEAAQELDFGLCDGHDPDDLVHADTIVVWGRNPYISAVHQLPYLREAKARGAKLVLIDPVWHRTAKLCDLYLQPKPGGDFDLAMGCARILFDEDWVDAQAKTYCDHFESYRALAMSRSAADWAQRAGVSEQALRSFAEMYGNAKAAAILAGWGMQRRSQGAATIRAVDALAAVSGNLGIAGGGVSYYLQRRAAFDLSFVQGLAAAPRSILEPRFGEEVLAAQDPPIRMLWVTAANPVAMLPDSARVAEAIDSLEFVVVCDSFLTDTARLADVVLPTTTMLEDEDVVGSYGHHWIGRVKAVLQPPEGVKTDLQILQELAPRVGLGDLLAGSPQQWIRRLLPGWSEKDLERLEQGPVRRPGAPEVLFAGRKFPTASGKVNLIHQEPESIAVPSEEFPLYLMSLSVPEAQASQWQSNQQKGPLVVTVHPDAARGIKEGEPAMLETPIGSMPVVLAFDSKQRPDFVLVPKGGWYHRGRSANTLTAAETTDLGGGAAYYDQLAALRPIRSEVKNADARRFPVAES
ncbi:MAG: molybdopterin-containing oxidoreductase catalytic subunit [Planctomycetota bacterium]|nr:MAG: molybdopterin-containing oxidoreductase catalytic subunit [Planctomycetota bacterium]